VTEYNREKERKAAERAAALGRHQVERDAVAAAAATAAAARDRSSFAAAAAAAAAADASPTPVSAAASFKPAPCLAEDDGDGSDDDDDDDGDDGGDGGGGDAGEGNGDAGANGAAPRGASKPVTVPSRETFTALLEEFHLSGAGGGKPLKVPVFCHVARRCTLYPMKPMLKLPVSWN